MFNGPSGAEVDLTQPEVVLLPHHCLRVTIGKVTQEQSTCVHALPSGNSIQSITLSTTEPAFQ